MGHRENRCNLQNISALCAICFKSLRTHAPRSGPKRAKKVYQLLLPFTVAVSSVTWTRVGRSGIRQIRGWNLKTHSTLSDHRLTRTLASSTHNRNGLRRGNFLPTRSYSPRKLSRIFRFGTDRLAHLDKIPLTTDQKVLGSNPYGCTILAGIMNFPANCDLAS